ncbi:hypothetical protein DM02DRAFT_618463, partial [Periconia macrospinosa]
MMRNGSFIARKDAANRTRDRCNTILTTNSSSSITPHPRPRNNLFLMPRIRLLERLEPPPFIPRSSTPHRRSPPSKLITIVQISILLPNILNMSV